MTASRDWIPHSKPTLGGEDADAVHGVVQSGFVGPGEAARTFEAKFAGMVGRAHARSTSTGSAALHLALLAAGVGPGDVVVIPALVCRAVFNVVAATGATPRLADIDPSDLNVSVAAARRALTASPEARYMVVVHSFGAPSSLFSASFPDVVLIEDGASSLGARVNEIPVGVMGLSSVFSFGSTKMMTTGQGGMVLTDDAEQVALIDKIRDYDRTLPGASGDGPGFNYNLSDLQATLGLSQLGRLDDFMVRRRAIAKSYSSALRGIPGVALPHGPSDGQLHSYYRYVFLVDEAHSVVERLQRDEIDARTSVTHFLTDDKSEFPGCEAVRSRIVSLPIYPSLTDSQVERITLSLLAALSR